MEQLTVTDMAAKVGTTITLIHVGVMMMTTLQQAPCVAHAKVFMAKHLLAGNVIYFPLF